MFVHGDWTRPLIVQTPIQRAFDYLSFYGTRTFHIYARPNGKFRAVKTGWNWPAWLLAMYLIYFYLLLPIAAMITSTILLWFVFLGLGIALPIWLGASVNKLRENRFRKKRYKFAGTVNAVSSKDAIALIASLSDDSPDEEEEEEKENNRDEGSAQEDFETPPFNDAPSRETELAKRYGQILGLRGKVTIQDIKKNYKDLIAKNHPDKVQHMDEDFQRLAETKTKEINEAYAYFKNKYSFD